MPFTSSRVHNSWKYIITTQGLFQGFAKSSPLPPLETNPATNSAAVCHFLTYFTANQLVAACYLACMSILSVIVAKYTIKSGVSKAIIPQCIHTVYFHS